MSPTRRLDLPALLRVVLSFSAACAPDDALQDQASDERAESAADESAGEIRESALPEIKVPADPIYEIEIPKSMVALPTVFRVTNRGSAVRSRIKSCWGDNPYRPQPEGAQLVTICPIEFAPSCSSLAAGETVPTDTCWGTSCWSSSIDLPPGQSDEVTWDGHYHEASTRGCWQEVALALGTQMTTKVCWGVPSAESQVTDSRCTVVSFAYGDPVVEVALD